MILPLTGTNLRFPDLDVIQVFFDTATFDKIDRDVKVLMNTFIMIL